MATEVRGQATWQCYGSIHWVVFFDSCCSLVMAHTVGQVAHLLVQIRLVRTWGIVVECGGDVQKTICLWIEKAELALRIFVQQTHV